MQTPSHERFLPSPSQGEGQGEGECRRATIATAIAALSLFVAHPTAQAAPHAHEHGVAKLSVAVDGNTLTIALDAPLDGFLGFERAPRTDAERKAAADLLVRLRDAGALFKPDAAAGCKAGEVKVEAPVLEPGYKGKGEHADLEAQFSFQCAQPQALRTLDVALFDTFKRLQRIDVQVAGAKGQSKATLKRPARTVTLAK
jgi:hypothetical protein